MNTNIENIFEDFKIKKKSKLPYYYQVYIYLLKKINMDELKIGQRLPNENKLCSLFDVSRVTIRKALNELAENNIISKIRGSGSYVLDKSEKTYDTEIKTLVETASKAEKEQSIPRDCPIVGYMSSSVGRIDSKKWRPLIRPTRDKYTIAYGTFVKGRWWYHDLVEKSITDTAASMGCEAIILDNKADKKIAIENTKVVIEKYKKKEIDFFINAQVHSDINIEISKMLEDAVVPSCSVEIYLNNFPYFHFNEYKMGFIAGQWLGNHANKNNWGRDEVEFIYLDMIAPGTSLREVKNGAFDGMRSFMKLDEEKCHTLKTMTGSIKEARKQMVEWLKTNPESKKILITGVANFLTLGASAALRETGREDDAAICSIYGTKDDFRELEREGTSYKAAICTFPEKYGMILIPYAVDYLEGNPVPADFMGYSVVMTTDNLGRFYPEFLLK